MCFHVENQTQIEKGLALEVRNETATFDVEMVEQDRKLNGVKIVTCPKSLRCLIAISLEQGFECYMTDLFRKQTVINLKTRLSRELMTPTLKSNICDVNTSKNNGTTLFTLSFTDGAFAVVDSNGQQVKVTATCLFGQSVLGNQEKFWAREAIQKSPYNSKFKSSVPVCSWLFANERLFYFTGLDVQTLETTLKFTANKPLPDPIISKPFPIVTIGNKVIMDDALFLESERVFVDYFYSCKLGRKVP
jgi:hypothetical protein